MDICDGCGYSWAAPLTECISSVATCAERFGGALAIVDATAVRTRPEPHTWSALEYTAHTADAVAWYHDRIERIILEDRPRLTVFDWDAACEERRYNERSVDVALRDVHDACARFVSRVRSLEPPQWTREGVGADGTTRSIEVLVRRTGHEAVHHPLDVARVLSAVADSPGQPGENY